MSKKKRVVSVVLGSALLTGIASGCGQGSSEGDSSSGPKEQRTYKMTYLNQNYDKTVKDSYAIKVVEDKFHVKIEQVPRSKDNFKEELLVKVASGEIPDVWVDLPFPEYDKLVEQGAVAEIPKDLLEKYAPKYMSWLKKHLGDNPLQFTMRNGKNYSMPIIWTLGPTSKVVGIREDWLQKAGINKMPETLEELEAAMRKFRNDDPDGNGKKDTYGWTGTGGKTEEMFSPVFGAFGVFPGIFTEDKGNIVRGEILPGAKDALTVLNRWYKDELIDPEFIVNKSKNVDDKVISEKSGVVVASWWKFIPKEAFIGGEYYAMKNKNPDVKWASFAGPKGPEGKQGTIQGSPIPSSGAQFGLHMEKDRDKMIKYIEIAESTAFDRDVFEKIVYGELGKTYRKTDDGGFEYLPPYDKEEEQIKFGIGQQYTFVGKSFNDYEFQTPYMTKNSLVSVRQKAETTGKGKYDVMKTIQLPQYNQISDKLEQLTIKNYVDFITGRRPLSEFDKFVDEWKKTGGEQAIQEAQKKYDENFKKK
ncbi:hypothetical protein GC093_34305 [Paenibacillus sp. LMG 31456]|uniref:ABC transporter substrate-binding protein n=1 Tax=Paenibacillus foliorum TaxID=2654974 RepID=A0A972K2Z1_9BACL|nr:extracellular solute-binding protein [Paenibacillus foliorum]NOU98259.1 hypothetical protein [Paenibacillus foliorum]